MAHILFLYLKNIRKILTRVNLHVIISMLILVKRFSNRFKAVFYFFILSKTFYLTKSRGENRFKSFYW